MLVRGLQSRVGGSFEKSLEENTNVVNTDERLDVEFMDILIIKAHIPGLLRPLRLQLRRHQLR